MDGTISIREYPKLKHAIQLYELHTNVPESNGILSNQWIYGPTGTGKSSWARDHYKDSLYVKLPNKWWDGYSGERTVLIDDF